MENTVVGIVILNYITWDDTKRCITSIRETTKGISYKIYVVDNASPVSPNDSMLSFLNENDIEYLPSDINRGYAAGNNIGIKRALDDGCNYILISNNDILYEEHSITRMVEAFSEDGEVGIIGPLVVNHDGSIQKGTRYNEGGLKQKYLAETLLRKVFPKYRIMYFGSDSDYENSSYVYAVSGCCFMLSKTCASLITPLDENTFLYGEEAIIGNRMLKKGLKTFYYPKSRVIHKHAGSTSHVKAFSYICKVKSEMYYCHKYLNSRVINIIPLYCFRTISFIVHSIFKKDYRKELSRYFKETWILNSKYR
ncbi:glycosyltransferase [Bacillus alkalisoli]|uniref:glycosyltransferase n=1 Tax=Bacillus alkalisoli TaxID=2011008 RepID=UPI000C244C31|nr:glycosyltransferase family 2 protein [Bacillus alkalisoli]